MGEDYQRGAWIMTRYNGPTSLGDVRIRYQLNYLTDAASRFITDIDPVDLYNLARVLEDVRPSGPPKMAHVGLWQAPEQIDQSALCVGLWTIPLRKYAPLITSFELPAVADTRKLKTYSLTTEIQ